MDSRVHNASQVKTLCRSSRCIISTQKPYGRKVKKIDVLARSSIFGSILKALRTDNGGEYLSTEFKKYLVEKGIEHLLTIEYTPQQNGVAERMNRTLVDLVRSMLYSKGLAKRFWAEALSTAVYIRNRVTTRSLPSDTTPLFKVKKSSTRFIRVCDR